MGFDYEAFTREAQRLSRPMRAACTVDLWVNQLDDDVAIDVTHAFERRDLTTPAIIAALKSQGLNPKFADFTLNRHRRQACSCFREGS